MSNADNRPTIRRLLFVADAAVADVDELPPSIRAIVDTAADVYVVTPTLPGRLAWLADDVDRFPELAAHAGSEEPVVVDDHDATGHGWLLGSDGSTSVPSPGVDVIVAVPWCRRMRPSIDSVSPRRPDGTSPRSKPTPRSRTKTFAPPPSVST